MKIIVKQVEGKTTRKGAKQNQCFTIIGECETKGFFYSISETGKECTIWDVRGDWSQIGIMKGDARSRCSYTRDFIIEY